MDKKKIIETILLASHQTISNDDIRKVLDQNLNSDKIISIINELNREYKEFNKGIYIDFISNGYQIRTIPELHKDASNNIIEHEPGTKFKFYLTDVSNNINNQDFCISTLLEDGKSFILEKKSEYVFIYGYFVDDFHILDKEKIFTVHHSAIQELDRQQQADKAEIAELKTEVATLKSELAAIKQHLAI